MSATSYRYCRVPPCCAAGYLTNKLAGAQVHTLPGGRSIVPLLNPQQHGLPFALTLELHASQTAAAAEARHPPIGQLPHLDRSVLALHYVLAGGGHLVRPGAAEELQAGDAVLMQSGAAACVAGLAGSAAGPVALASLVTYMPQQLFDQAQQQQQQADELALQHAASLQPLLQHASDEAGVLPEAVVAELLAGAKETARQALFADPPGQPATSSSTAGSHDGDGSGSSSSTGSGGLRWPPFLQPLVSSLSSWWQRQQARTCPVTKRSLAQLTAFQLPNQTNRLAVQFDPYSRPQVPFISGIEVFERGHRTDPHVHPRAHELFFILAGRGEGFCGPPGPAQDRFPVAAGDVVVFRPGAVHGIDNSAASRMYCLELMVPNEQFAEFVRMGTDTGHLAQEDLCVLASIGCR